MIFTYGEGVYITGFGLRGGGGGDSIRCPGGLPALRHQYRRKSVGAGNTGGPGHYPEHHPSGGLPQVQEEEEIDKEEGLAPLCGLLISHLNQPPVHLPFYP